MKTEFRIVMYDENGALFSLEKSFETYEEAETEISEVLPEGIYQIQKVFIKSE